MSFPLILFFLDGDPKKKFSIDPVAGTLSCDPLDREEQALYNLTIQAKDRGSPTRSNTSTVVIKVLDDNDNDPKFRQSRYSKVIPEDTSVGSSILKVDIKMFMSLLLESFLFSNFCH